LTCFLDQRPLARLQVGVLLRPFVLKCLALIFELAALLLDAKPLLRYFSMALVDFLLPLAIALAAVAGILLFEAQLVTPRVELGPGFFEILLHRGEAVPAFLVMVVKLPAHIRHLLANLGQLLLLMLDLRSALFEQGFAPL